MEQAKRVAKNTGFLYARMGITVFVSLYATRLVLDELGEVDFGIYAVVGSVISMLVFLNSAMSSASQRFMSFSQGQGNEMRQKQIFNVSLVLHSIIAVFLVLLLEIIGFFIFDSFLQIPDNRLNAAKIVFHCMVLSTFFSVLTVPYNAIINAHENMFFVATLGVLEALLKLGIALYLIYTVVDQLIFYGFFMALLTIGLALVRSIYCHRKYDEVIIDSKRYFNRHLFTEMTSFAGWSFIGSSTSMITNYGQTIVINMFFGPTVNAAQGIANQVNGQLGSFSFTMLKALNPSIDKSEGAGRRKTMLEISLFGSKVSFFLASFFIIPVLIEMRYIFEIWLKEIPNYAIIFCSLLLIRQLIEQMFLPIATAISAVGQIKYYKITTSLLNIFPLVISYVFFMKGFPPHYMYLVFIGYAIANGMTILYYAKKECQLSIKYFLRNNLLKELFAFTLIFIISYLPTYFIQNGNERILAVLVLNFVFFIIVTWAVGFSTKERIFLNKTINSIIKKK